MADGSNLKAKVGMDTGDFEKGAKKVTKAAQSMGKEIGTSLGDVGRALGVDTGLVGDLARNIENATTLFRGMSSAGSNAASTLSKAMVGLGGAIAGLGISAAIVAFRELNAQAASFEQRLQGVNLAASAKAYRDTYSQALYDASGAGNFWANFKERSKNYFATNMAQIATLSFGSERRGEAERKAQRAAELADEMVELRRKQRDLGIEIQGIDNRIAEAQNKFRDSAASAAERKQAEATITELISQKYAKQADLQGQMLANVKERNTLTDSTEAELDEQANLEKGLLALQGQQQQELNAMLRVHNSINTAVGKTKQTVQETVSLLEQVVGSGMAERLDSLIGNEIDSRNVVLQRVLNEGDSNLFKGLPGFDNQAQALKVPGIVKPEYDPQEWIDLSSELASIIGDALDTVGTSLGQLIGDLATGGDAWGNFTSSAISAFGEMATTVGKIAVSTGMATLGIKAALESLNPYVAIAAGTALIALGSAVRAGMANVSAGSYSTSVASSAYTSGAAGPSAFGREMEVKVTGTLTANGSQLVAVLNNENDRKNYTT